MPWIIFCQNKWKFKFTNFLINIFFFSESRTYQIEVLTTSESREEITVVRLSPQALKESLRKTLKAKTNVSTKIMIFKKKLGYTIYQISTKINISLQWYYFVSIYLSFCTRKKLSTFIAHNRHQKFLKSLWNCWKFIHLYSDIKKQGKFELHIYN